MANACDICGKLYNYEPRVVRGKKGSADTNVMIFVRRDGAGRPYIHDILCCPDCADKVYRYIQTMNTDEVPPEFIYNPMELDT